MKEYKEGEYIRYQVNYPGSENSFHSGGVVEGVSEKNGKKQYLVSEGNGGANMTYVNPEDILTLLTE